MATGRSAANGSSWIGTGPFPNRNLVLLDVTSACGGSAGVFRLACPVAAAKPVIPYQPDDWPALWLRGHPICMIWQHAWAA